MTLWSRWWHVALPREVDAGRRQTAPPRWYSRWRSPEIRRLLAVLVLAALVGGYFYTRRPPTSLVLTGIVTTRTIGNMSRVSGATEDRFSDTPPAGHSETTRERFRPGEIPRQRGYARTRDGETLAFVIMANGFEGPGAAANDAIDRIAARRATFSLDRLEQ